MKRKNKQPKPKEGPDAAMLEKANALVKKWHAENSDPTAVTNELRALLGKEKPIREGVDASLHDVLEGSATIEQIAPNWEWNKE